MANKKIALIKTGGTISSEYDGEQIMVGKVNGLKIDADIVLQPFTCLSENMHNGQLVLLIQSIEQCLKKTDAVIVTHGTDTLVYTAAFLSYWFNGIHQPIIMVSSDFPLSDARANGHKNIETAMRFIHQCSFGGVFVPYQNPNKANAVHFAHHLLAPRAFDGSLFSALDTVCVSANCDEWNVIQQPSGQGYAFDREQAMVGLQERLDYADSAIETLAVTPLTDYLRTFKPIVVVEGYHSGTVRSEGQNSICSLNASHVLLCGGLKGAKYESLAGAAKKLIVLDQITPIALVQKLKFLIAVQDAKPLETCKKDICGEFF